MNMERIQTLIGYITILYAGSNISARIWFLLLVS